MTRDNQNEPANPPLFAIAAVIPRMFTRETRFYPRRHHCGRVLLPLSSSRGSKSRHVYEISVCASHYTARFVCTANLRELIRVSRGRSKKLRSWSSACLAGIVGSGITKYPRSILIPDIGSKRTNERDAAIPNTPRHNFFNIYSRGIFMKIYENPEICAGLDETRRCFLLWREFLLARSLISLSLFFRSLPSPESTGSLIFFAAEKQSAGHSILVFPLSFSISPQLFLRTPPFQPTSLCSFFLLLPPSLIILNLFPSPLVVFSPLPIVLLNLREAQSSSFGRCTQDFFEQTNFETTFFLPLASGVARAGNCSHRRHLRYHRASAVSKNFTTTRAHSNVTFFFS